MAYDVNVLVLGGRLVKDPIARYTSNETAVANFRIASGLGKEKTLFIDVTAWGKQAELVNEYLGKGSQVIISGYLDEDTWVGDDDVKRSKFKIVANSVQFVGGKKDSSDNKPLKEEVDNSGDIDDLLSETFDEEDFPL